MSKVGVRFGAMCPAPSKQIPGLSTGHDADAEAITRLAVRGVLVPSEVDKARRRLMKRIKRELDNREEAK